MKRLTYDQMTERQCALMQQYGRTKQMPDDPKDRRRLRAAWKLVEPKPEIKKAAEQLRKAWGLE